MRRGTFKRIFLSVAGLLLLSLSVLGIALFLYVKAIGPFAFDAMYVPDYPSAQNLQVLIQKDPHDVNWSEEPYKIVTFVTSDNPDQVFAYFKDTLLHRPFEDWRSNMAKQDKASFSIIGFGRGMSPPMYTFAATTEQQNGLTHVRIERYYFPGM